MVDETNNWRDHESERSCTKDLINRRTKQKKMQAGAVYIKFFVNLLVYVHLYTQFQKSRAPWSVEFHQNSLLNLQKTFTFVSNPNPLQGDVKSNI